MIQEKLFAIQKLLKTYSKDWKANYGKYITLDNLLSEILPICNDHDVLITHSMRSSHVVTTVTDISDNTSVESAFPVSATVPQQIGWAITYGKRYNIGQIFNIATDEDIDWKIKEPKSKSKMTQKNYDDFVKFVEWKSAGEIMQHIVKAKAKYDTSDFDLQLTKLANG